MKKTSFLIIIFFFLNFYGQILDNIKKQDTIYFYFNHGKYQSTVYENIEKNAEKKRREHFCYKLSSQEYFTLVYNEIWDFEGNLTDVRVLKKSFLRKNKKNIITIDEILKYGMRNIIENISQKTIYVIDSKEEKNGKITVRQVILISSFTVE
jgi:hypothetical protein